MENNSQNCQFWELKCFDIHGYNVEAYGDNNSMNIDRTIFQHSRLVNIL